MDLTIKEYILLNKIKFDVRYKELSKKNQFELTFENYSNEEIIKIIDNLGYKSKYYKSGNFFKIEEKISDVLFYLNISLKYGLTEFIIGGTKITTKQFIYGGTFGNIFKDMNYFIDKVENDTVSKPSFRNYDDLQIILKEALSIYEDFKYEFLKQDNSNV